MSESILLRLNDDSAIDVVDQPLFYVLKRTTSLNDDVRATMDRWIAEFAELRVDGDSYEESLGMLRSMASEVEARIADRLALHSLPFWLMLFRSILALNSASDFAESDHLVRDTRLIELTIAKHSRYDVDDVVFHGGTWSIEPEPGDILNLLESAALAHLASTCEADIRRLAHGGVLTKGSDGWQVVLPASVNDLMILHRDRNARFGNIFRHSGVPGQPVLRSGRGHWWIALAGRNESRLHWSGLTKTMELYPSVPADISVVSETDSYIPTFALLEFDLDEEISWLRMADTEIRSRLGFRAKVALLLLRACAHIGMESYGSYRLGHRVRTLAFTMIQRNALISRAIGDSQDEDGLRNIDLDEWERAYRFLARDARSASEVDVNSLSGFRTIVDLGQDHVLLDFNVTVSALQSLFRVLGASGGGVATVRGSAFEDYVADRILTDPSQMSLWAFRHSVEFYDRSAAEIDVAVLIDDVLLLCECKASSQHGFGESQTQSQVDARWRHWCQILEKVDLLGVKLSERRLRRPQPIPAHVRWILPCVVTTGVEWVPTNDATYWFGSGTPRICVAGEATIIARRVLAGERFDNMISCQS